MSPSLSLLLLFLSLSPFLSSALESNPPTWGTGVYVADPANPSATQAAIDSAFALNGGHSPPENGQFSPSRFAFLFKPGVHDVTMNVGYYMHVMGMGASPTDVNIREVTCENGNFNYEVGALDNFWRAAENFYTKPTRYFNSQNFPSMLWAVSQAAPLRRVYVDGHLNLYQYNYGCCAGYASGGYMSNSYVAGTGYSGSQQQWMNRNVHFGDWNGGGWNMVFVGCDGGLPDENCYESPVVKEGDSPVVAEKPFIVIDDAGKYSIAVPPLENNKVGASDFSKGLEGHKLIDFENVFVASPSVDASVINQKLSEGVHVVFGPGIYNLTDTIVVPKDDLVVLGIGFPTLVPTTGKPALQIQDVNGVRVAGLLYQAGKKKSESLVVVGQTRNWGGDKANPVVMHDVFARVGGPTNQEEVQVSANKMLEVNTRYVVLDNTWFWRADHSASGLVKSGQNPCQTGVLVEGDSVIAYGLAVEHTLQDMVQWRGDNGQIFFYQSEFPYDVNTTYAQKGYTSIRIDTNVNHHKAVGIGAYCYFRDYPVYVESGFKVDSPSKDIHIKQAISVFLNGKGGINHVVNSFGNSTKGTFGVQPVCNYN